MSRRCVPELVDVGLIVSVEREMAETCRTPVVGADTSCLLDDEIGVPELPGGSVCPGLVLVIAKLEEKPLPYRY